LLTFGGGGGGSNDSYSSTASGGGSGGGIVFVIANTFTLNGTISCNGGAGADAGVDGGGGAGGSVLIKCRSGALGTNRITVTAGGAYSTGGIGAVGRIHCDYFSSVTGSATPTIDTAQDSSLNSAIYGSMI
jgi:hypothetical protein